ncbi:MULTISPECIES: zinc ribbon domain-containing protein [Paenibacillus]|uniref:Zinc ribbon domain-containing protein n=1 Tax=Paenibacillus residui TaxID=629724 RepID=A0ABW3DBR5_9BACL|nr:zinc ribbon domain-containing protein [Paenibacillus sp. 32O-W]
MKGFLNKFKEGAAEAAKMAQQTLEITRMKAQISTKEREVEKYFEAIGEEVFNAYTVKDLSQAEPFIEEAGKQIIRIRQEIRELELKIKEVKQIKECACGRNVPLEANYCPSCGYRFEEREPPKLICSSCGTRNEAVSKYCYHCGQSMELRQLPEKDDWEERDTEGPL